MDVDQQSAAPGELNPPRTPAEVRTSRGPGRRRRRWVPAASQVLLGMSGLAALVTLLLAVPGNHGAPPPARVVGETELVRITSPDGSTVQTLARIDTGASASAIDEEIAEDLGLDLDDAPTVDVRSSLGVEERPVVGVAIQLAGRAMPARVSVSDRSELSEQVLVGREELAGFQVSVGRSLLTRPGEAVAPSATEALLLQTAALAPTTLLAMLPMCVLFIVVLRLWVGISTLGTFGPVLLAISYVQSGLFVGLGLTMALFVLGLVIQLMLRRSKVPRVARLGILIAVVATVLAQLQSASSAIGAFASWGAALPVVVTATVIERLWETWDDEGFTAVAVQAGITLGVSVLVAALLLAPALRYLAEATPAHFALACVLWTWVAGSYKGLRLTELFRFAPASRGVREGWPA